MPIGSRHVETGRLDYDGTDFCLRRDGGGTWRLDVGFVAGWRARRLLGRRVQVTGSRVGFDVLAVETLVETAVPLVDADDQLRSDVANA